MIWCMSIYNIIPLEHENNVWMKMYVHGSVISKHFMYHCFSGIFSLFMPSYFMYQFQEKWYYCDHCILHGGVYLYWLVILSLFYQSFGAYYTLFSCHFISCVFSRQNGFSVITADRIYTFTCESPEEVGQWVDGMF